MKVQRYLILPLLIALVSVLISAQIQTEIRPLSVGQPIERELKGDEAHLYSIAVSAGQFLDVVVDQRGIDVVVMLFGADGKKLAEVDSPNGRHGQEPVSIITETTGSYRLEVRSLDKPGAIGRYEVKIKELRTTKAQDKTRIAADQTFIQATLLLVQGMNEGTAEFLKSAIRKYEECLPLYRSLGDASREALTLNTIGTIYKDLGERQKALDYFAQSLALYRTVRDRRREGIMLNNIGGVYRNVGERQKALDYYTKALPIYREVGDREGEATVLNNIGVVYTDLGEQQGALDYFTQALRLDRALKDRASEAATLDIIGSIYRDLGENQKALDSYEQALTIYRAVEDHEGEATIFNNIGFVHSLLGESQKALDYYAQALSLYRSIKDRDGEATTLVNIGSIYALLGENQKALDCYEQSLAISRAVGNPSIEAKTLGNIGNVYNDLGEKKKALDYFTQVLPLFRAMGDRDGEATALSSIGITHHFLGENQKALDFYSKALPLFRAIKDRRGEATMLGNIGAIYLDLGEKQKALDYHTQALSLFRGVGYRKGEATALNNLGKFYSKSGETLKAADYYAQSLPISRAVGDRGGEANTLNNLMFVYESLNNSRFAVFYGKRSVNVYQQLRSNVQVLDTDVQKTYMKSVEDTYRNLGDLLIAQGRSAEAQEVLNAFKDQQFFDFDRTQQKELKSVKRTPREEEFVLGYEKTSDALGAIGGKIAELKRKIGNRKPNDDEAKQLQQLEADLKIASDEFSAVLKQAEGDFSQPLSDKDKVGEIPDTKEMQTALRSLQSQTGQKAVAIYTLEANENYRALLITPDKIAAVSYPIKAVELRQKAVNFLGRLSGVDKQTNAPKSSTSEVQKTGKELYDILYAPVDAKLKELKLKPDVLMWSLDGALRYLPVAALHDGKQYMAERYKNVVFTRSNSERMLTPVSPTWTGSGFYNSKEYSLPVRSSDDGKAKLIGFDGLKNAKTEVETIFGISPGSGIIGGDLLFDEHFTKESFFSALKLNRPLVHIASHFKFEAGDASSSFLLLGDGTKLTLEDIKNAPDDLFKGVELLTLSACETGVQKERESDGREIDGFAELAQRKGAKAVVASLWKVDDESTSHMMTQFYQTRQRKKITKAEALQRAQLTLLKSKEFSHPFYWSPFILFGNWR